ncbi:hypothetical protein TNCV_2725131 [Trichonephila clavipes]|nr:hypothetical protein TNCV_2725131 [Trichonephila clavipes]
MRLNEEIVEPLDPTRIPFERCCVVKSCCDISCKKQKCTFLDTENVRMLPWPAPSPNLVHGGRATISSPYSSHYGG